MPIRNQHWYDANGSTAYPVSDASTQVDDADSRLPPNVIVDLNLRWPDTLGQYAFVSGVTVSEHAVTVVLQAATSLEDDPVFSPLAVVTVRQPVTIGRVYALAAQADGVGGWIVFGDGVTDPGYRGRFSSPEQSALAPRAARAYRPPPVTGVRVLNAATTLTGLVTLRAVSPLELVREDRVIDGVLRDALVLRMTDQTGTDGVVAATAPAPEDNVFRQFAGPCAGRPESGTCPDPQPVEFVNSVGPDCDGVLTVEFNGCATVARFADGHGVLVDCDLGLGDACVPPRLPDSDGNLP